MNKHNIPLLAETILFIAIISLAFSWYRNPDGNYEPIIVFLTTIFVITEGYRRYALNGSGKNDFKVTDLYPEILLDYQGVSIKKILQDFGEASSEFDDLEGFLGLSFVSDNFKVYNYEFKKGAISFYVEKNGLHATVVDIHIKAGIKILVPGIHENGPNYPGIILGKSKFKDLISISMPSKTYSNYGSSPQSNYVGAEFYFGLMGGYSTYTFGIQGYLTQEDLSSDFSSIEDEKPNYVAIH